MFRSIHVISARYMSMHISTDANLLQSPFEKVIDVDLIRGKTVKISSTDSCHSKLQLHTSLVTIAELLRTFFLVIKFSIGC